jgi:membrane associated rhomboid family serine protease
MGIYDREYYRRDGPSLLAYFSDRGAVCKWLILINVVVFVLQLLTRNLGVPDGRAGLGAFTEAFYLQPDKVLHGQVWRLVTYAFLHDPYSLFHIVFNMLFLWWFGSELEGLYGSKEFLAFYLAGVLAGGLAYLAYALSAGAGPCLGASGAVTAVMVLYALHFPRRVIYIWFVLPIPIWVFVGFQVLMDTLQWVGNVQTGVAVTAHLGGAAFGFMYYIGGWRLASLWQGLGNWRRQRARPRLRVYRDDEEQRMPVPVPSASSPDVDEHLEAKLDAVLEKVARQGRDSLTESERQILYRASEIYRRRQRP